MYITSHHIRTYVTQRHNFYHYSLVVPMLAWAICFIFGVFLHTLFAYKCCLHVRVPIFGTCVYDKVCDVFQIKTHNCLSAKNEWQSMRKRIANKICRWRLIYTWAPMLCGNNRRIDHLSGHSNDRRNIVFLFIYIQHDLFANNIHIFYIPFQW